MVESWNGFLRLLGLTIRGINLSVFDTVYWVTEGEFSLYKPCHNYPQTKKTFSFGRTGPGWSNLGEERRPLHWVLSHQTHFTVLRFIFVYVYFMYMYFVLIICCIIITCWGGPGGIEGWSLGPLLPSVLLHCWLGHFTRKKPVPDMTYNVFSGTLNPTQSVSQPWNKKTRSSSSSNTCVGAWHCRFVVLSS